MSTASVFMTYGKKTLAFSWFFDCLFNRISNVTDAIGIKKGNGRLLFLFPKFDIDHY